MKRKSIVLFLLISFCTMPAWAKPSSIEPPKHIEYMNMDFWNKFNDDILTENLITVYENNRDLKSAALKVNQAQRVVKMTFANQLPYIGFDGYIGRIFDSADQVFGNLSIPNYSESHFLLPLTMNYEVDIWGENRLKTKYKQKELEMLQQDERATYIMISSAFACYYYNLIRIDKFVEYQEQLVDLQSKVVNALETRYLLGTATISDIERAKKEYTFMEETLLSWQGKRDAIMNQLNVLLANKQFTDVPRCKYDNIKLDICIPEGIDFDAMANRPDRIKAELNLKKTGIDIKIAQRDMLPKFIITGNLGFNMYNLSSAHKFLADLGVVPVWDIFTGGRKIQMLKFKKDTYNLAIEQYEKTLLTSFQETDDALFTLKTLAKIESAIDERVISDEKEMNYIKIKEKHGIVDNLDLFLQEEKLLITKQQQMVAKINEIIASINLYQALGGVDFSTQTGDSL